MAEHNLPTLLTVLQQTLDYPSLRPLHDRAMKTLLKLAADEKKALDEEAKKEAVDKAVEDAKVAAAAKAAAAKATVVEAPKTVPPPKSFESEDDRRDYRG